MLRNPARADPTFARNQNNNTAITVPGIGIGNAWRRTQQLEHAAREQGVAEKTTTADQ